MTTETEHRDALQAAWRDGQQVTVVVDVRRRTNAGAGFLTDEPVRHEYADDTVSYSGVVVALTPQTVALRLGSDAAAHIDLTDIASVSAA
jgi:hypothetical protein